MEKFATNIAGNIDSGTEVLANNMVFLQDAKANAISNLYGDLFTEGILNINMGTSGNVIEPFELKNGNTAGKFSVGFGIAYKKDVNTGIVERIAILEEAPYQNEPFGNATYHDGRGVNQKTYDGVDNYVATPKSSGCVDIDIPSVDTEYYVDIRYVNVCDNGNDGTGTGLKNYSLAKSQEEFAANQRKRFYQWVDGYNVVLISNLVEREGIIVGTVSKDSNNVLTFTTNGRDNNFLIQSRVFMEYFTSGQGIVIQTDAETDQTTVSVNVDNKTTEIEDNYVRVTKDGLYPFTKFCANSGFTDTATGQPNILAATIGGTEVYLNFGAGTPLVVSPAYNDQYTVTSDMNISGITNVVNTIQQEYSETAVGTYTICINNTDKENSNAKLDKPVLEILKGITVSRVSPSNSRGNLWYDISSEPCKAKWYNGSEWEEYHGVPLGEIDISGSVISALEIYKFNTNGYTAHIPTAPGVTKYWLASVVSGSKNTVYETGEEIIGVCVSGDSPSDGGYYLQVSADNSNWTEIARFTHNDYGRETQFVIICPHLYWKVTGGADATIKYAPVSVYPYAQF